VAQTLSFSRAAKMNYITQTAVSQQIKSLEQELGALLFTRTHHSTQLTAAGAVLYDHAVQILAQCDLAQKEVYETSQAQTESLHIAIARGLESTSVMESLLSFKSLHPSLELHFYKYDYNQLFTELQNQSVDLVLSLEIFPGSVHDFSRFQCSVWQNYVAMNRQNPLSRQHTLKAEQLKNETLYILSGNDAFLRTLHLAGLNINTAQTVDSVETAMLNIVFYGGYMVLAEPVIASLSSNHNLVFIPLENNKVPVCLYWNAHKEDPTLLAFLDYLQNK
jgi:DNA-binding transcriptional LysR family regulator